MDHLDKHINRGDHAKARRILDYVKGESEIDFFSVAVPDKGSPQQATGYLTGDGKDGFVTQGFNEVIRWFQK